MSSIATAAADLPDNGLAPAWATPADQGMRRLVQALLPLWHRHLVASRSESDRGVSDLLMHLSTVSTELDELAAAVGLANNAPSAPQSELQQVVQRLLDAVDGALVSFQFQDRVNQMLGVVQDDIDRLNTWVESDPVATTDAHVQIWLERLAASYTMPEQMALHDPTHDAAGPRGVEFF
jgi:hypothetical protein